MTVQPEPSAVEGGLSPEQQRRLLAYAERIELNARRQAAELEHIIDTGDSLLGWAVPKLAEIERVRDEYDDEGAAFAAVVAGDGLANVREARFDAIDLLAQVRDRGEQWARLVRRWTTGQRS